MIQDIVFAVGSLAFIAALVPMVRAEEKPPFKSSLITGSVLFAFGVCYGSLHLPLACVTAFVSSALWLVLALQKGRSNA